MYPLKRSTSLKIIREYKRLIKSRHIQKSGYDNVLEEFAKQNS